jgi:hypothetical protein
MLTDRAAARVGGNRRPTPEEIERVNLQARSWVEEYRSTPAGGPPPSEAETPQQAEPAPAPQVELPAPAPSPEPVPAELPSPRPWAVKRFLAAVAAGGVEWIERTARDAKDAGYAAALCDLLRKEIGADLAAGRGGAVTAKQTALAALLGKERLHG